jgi:hypothetical protein
VRKDRAIRAHASGKQPLTLRELQPCCAKAACIKVSHLCANNIAGFWIPSYIAHVTTFVMSSILAPLSEPLKLGELKLPTRNFMAPLTRTRCVPTNVPGDHHVVRVARSVSSHIVR